MKKTLVLGASTKPERYAYKCIKMLRDKGFDTVAVGLRKGEVAGVSIETEKKFFEDIHTVAIYISARNLKDYEEYIISLKPERVIFPPGTENPEYEQKLTEAGIFNERACPLVMLSIGNY